MNKMDLWIRSQDKELLIKSEKIMIEEGKDVFAILNYIDTKNWFKLGVYKTKERALEVLDEIHDRIATLTTIDLIGLNDANLKIFNKYLKEKPCSVIYQMPEE